LNEQLMVEYGFSVSIGQTADVGDRADETNGAIGAELFYGDPSMPQWFLGLTDGPGNLDFIKTGNMESDFLLDPDQALTTMGAGFVYPYTLCDWRSVTPVLSPAWDHSNSQIVRVRNELLELNNVDIIFTSDKDQWSRCVIVETANDFYYDIGTGLGIPTEGDAESFDLRQAPSVGKNADGNGLPETDGDGMGMGWFPGYAIDVETGKRLNIFFGENSTYDGSLFPESYDVAPNGRDMMWNPNSQQFLDADPVSLFNFMNGGQHYIYVTRTEYDECAEIRTQLEGSAFQRVGALENISWTAFPILPRGVELLSYADGLIPNDLTIQMRVDNPYAVEEGTGEANGYPKYRFKLEGVAPSELVDQTEIDAALDQINVVPNPYYGYSAYETTQFTNTVKITNLPAQCIVTIYSMDGKFIRQYKRNEAPTNKGGTNPPVATSQINPAIEWDLKNNKGIPVASGTYIIHIDADGLGERVIKWFGVARQFDPSGL